MSVVLIPNLLNELNKIILCERQESILYLFEYDILFITYIK
jgi:hypothetical protein